jgi:hypothetical protein
MRRISQRAKPRTVECVASKVDVGQLNMAIMIGT